ncbi:MAG: metalloregulator ArsR/SmtB family transcription factor [Chloroflexi bacterium]|jgi:DNA-binding transcriptional ArsR family regulator|nr:metalloregulator ArsR/SmtB family transcription factor [Chloroflexota bacterium]
MTPQPKPADEVKIAALFDQLRQPARIQIMLIIREQPACVCHLVAALGLRQAAISQHLMALREAGWVTTRRESRNIYYSLSDKRLVNLIEQGALIADISFSEMEKISRRPLENCPCPQCHPELPPEYSCKSVPTGYQKKS